MPPLMMRWVARCFLTLTVVVGVQLPGLAFAGSSRAPLWLAAGDAVVINGTDLACAFGGPANHNGLECVHDSKAGARSSWTFRLEEDQLSAFHIIGGVQRSGRSWHEVHTFSEPQSPAVGDASNLIGHVSVGQSFTARATDLGCVVSRSRGVITVTCAKRGGNGTPVRGSYDVVTTQTALRVQLVTATSKVKTVYVGG